MSKTRSTSKSRSGKGRSAAVIVLGDVGHSPRMAYHTLSLASHHTHAKESTNTAIEHVYLVGYATSSPHPAVKDNPRISITPIPTYLWTWTSRFLPFFLSAPIKAILQTFSLLFTLLFLLPRGIDLFLLQTPPAVPALPVAIIASRIRSIPLVVDWHNLGYTILALRYRSPHGGDHRYPLLVRIYRFVEAYFAPFAHRHLCVSQAFADFLHREFNIIATVVYDRPHPLFIQNASLSLIDRHHLFSRIMPQLCLFDTNNNNNNNNNENKDDSSISISTPFTVLKDTQDKRHASLRKDRPLLLVSSTSWTRDEDFGLLLGALRIVREYAPDMRIHAVITGKGPEKAMYEAQMEKEGLLVSSSTSSSITSKTSDTDSKPLNGGESSNVSVETAWLQAEDYPRLLAAADLGVCLHRSSSGVDLPMKVIDMFGAGIPVCAVEYPTIYEQVEHESTGLIFRTAKELADQLMRLGRGFPTTDGPTELDRMKETVAATFRDEKEQWTGHWNTRAWPVMEGVMTEAH